MRYPCVMDGQAVGAFEPPPPRSCPTVSTCQRAGHEHASRGASPVVDARNRHQPAAVDRPKVCAVLQIRTQKAFADVKSFSPCFVPMREAVAMPSPPARVGGERAGMSVVLDAKVLLLSVFLSTHRRLSGCARVCDDLGKGVAERLRRVLARCAEGRPCEFFSRGLLTVKKSVIRFRPADLAAKRVSRIDIQLRSTTRTSAARPKTVESASLPPVKCKDTPHSIPAWQPAAGIPVSVTTRSTRRRSPHSTNGGFALPGRFNSIDH